MKTAIVRGTLGIDQLKRKLTLSKKSDLVGKIKEFFNRDDVSRTTEGKRETVTYKKCVRKCEVIERSSKKVKITKNVKEIVEGTVPELIGRFNKTLRELKKHSFNITTQYRSYRDVIDNLKSDEIVLHINFSENYSCKCFEEVQCHHFGGSRKQVTLHTGVMYTKTEEEDKPTIMSFCTNSHTSMSIWTHHPVISNLKTVLPNITTIHFFSDGPATQYRQKLNFYFIFTEIFKYNFVRVTWNFFEAGHGKGAADGIGGYLKRTADKKVATGSDISDSETFFHTLRNSSKVRLYLVTDNDIENVEKTVPKNVVPLQGTMQVHQVFTDTPDGLKNKELLADISNVPTESRRSYYSMVYSPSSSSDEEVLANLDQPSVSNVKKKQLIHKENVHPSKISDGVYVLVKISSVNDKHYTYLGVAKSTVDEEGDVKVMFYKTVDCTSKIFKAVETDISYEPYYNILQIVLNPKMVMKGSITTTNSIGAPPLRFNLIRWRGVYPFWSSSCFISSSLNDVGIPRRTALISKIV
ncbi:unnamed protein product [Acanthoscelides obtectus]|uniref:Uncharacterized protein n=1 Tax=Acanthoscelides obtectus TaxID=200917 RepID=A0A9P0Q3L6_ACAOB|nr:unnamed protein product [Acanthoscelides obtectus]CAK1623152.1 hypothetical protein AOBTE_LOCUS1836 [Acanthoscelides obtectus]